ncbi:hypothetical protein FBU30_009742 [Linnemannia zychae]|nr:hypothetical protein FBU30_009742 [Linnemannia zychae]
MNKEALMASIYIHNCTITNLEAEERRYITRLQPSPPIDFDTTHDKQQEREKLYAVRIQIHNIALELKDLIAQFRIFDIDLADEYSSVLLQKVQERLAGLHFEENAYIRDGHGDDGINAHHVHKNRRLISMMTHAFNINPRG